MEILLKRRVFAGYCICQSQISIDFLASQRRPDCPLSQQNHSLEEFKVGGIVFPAGALHVVFLLEAVRYYTTELPLSYYCP